MVFSERVSTMPSTAIYGPETRRVDAAARAIPIVQHRRRGKKLFLTVVCRGSDWRGRGRGEVRHPGMKRTSGVHEFFTILSSSSVTLLIVACVVCGACAGACVPVAFAVNF